MGRKVEKDVDRKGKSRTQKFDAGKFWGVIRSAVSSEVVTSSSHAIFGRIPHGEMRVNF
jgi:hypothetical protein